MGKLGLVIGGYATAFLIACAVVYVYELCTQDVAAQASAGMYAGGELILFIATFGVLSLIPTALAVYFLFWKFRMQ